MAPSLQSETCKLRLSRQIIAKRIWEIVRTAHAHLSVEVDSMHFHATSSVMTRELPRQWIHKYVLTCHEIIMTGEPIPRTAEIEWQVNE